MVGELIDRLRDLIYRWRDAAYDLGARRIGFGIALGCLVVAGAFFLSDRRDEAGLPAGELAVAHTENVDSADRHAGDAGGNGGDFDSGAGADGAPGPSSTWVSTRERVERHESLPCTGAKEPINFEVFSAGPAVAGLPLTGFKRRCGATTPVDEPPANFTNYVYGDCELAKGSSSCVPPLEIQTWPACERSLADYSFEGKPMPYRRLASDNGAHVVEIQFEFEPRIEIYSKSSTIVIFAEDLALAEEAVAQLTSQKIGNPPATKAGELKGQPAEGLAPPSDGATEGELSC